MNISFDRLFKSYKLINYIPIIGNVKNLINIAKDYFISPSTDLIRVNQEPRSSYLTNKTIHAISSIPLIRNVYSFVADLLIQHQLYKSYVPKTSKWKQDLTIENGYFIIQY